jgi:tellurite methyltransferase
MRIRIIRICITDTVTRPAVDRSVEFFERQFKRQVRDSDYAFNPFERAILPYLRGEVLDLGCGLGNLALAAAESGCRVTALDASLTAIADLGRRAHERGLHVEAQLADLRRYVPEHQYDGVVAIGLLMFFSCGPARTLLARIRDAVRPGGVAAINVLIEGTTYMDMFDGEEHCLFGRDELTSAFDGWSIELSRHEDFPAPRGTVKKFHTLIARSRC